MQLKILLWALLACSAAYGHEGQPPAPHDIWTAWSFDPAVVAALAVSGSLYLKGSRPISRADAPGRGIRSWEAASFWGGWTALVLALVSPVHAAGGALFSAHMIQHEVLMLIAAPLLVLGRPLVPFLWAIPENWRRSAGSLSKYNWFRSSWRLVTEPIVAWSFHAAALWTWHAPSLFQASVENELVHTAQHLSFLVSALLFWWALIRGREARLGYGAAVLYVFTTAMHSSILGALLTFAPTVWYPVYEGRTLSWGFSALEDQQLGGLVMWVPAGVIYLAAGLVLLAAWLRESDARTLNWNRNIAILFCIGILGLSGLACNRSAVGAASAFSGGDFNRGKVAIVRRGCPACHMIPGIEGADGLVGPPLNRIASRVYLAGVLPNTPDNLVRWLRNPPAQDSKTAMPNMGITEQEARDIAAYLLTLK